MEFLKSYQFTPRRILIIVTVAVGALVLIGLLQNVLRPYQMGGIGMNVREEGVTLGMPSPMMYDNDSAYDSYSLSARNVVTSPIIPPGEGAYTPGDSEAFEVKNYSAYIETDDLKSDCGIIEGLKSRSEVIFENTATSDRGCSFTFKVEKTHVESILSMIESLDPQELSEQVYTIKREVDDYTSEVDILTKKLAALDQAYAEAIAAYAGITDMATRGGDVENLAKIIESKLALIERLTQTRLDVAADLERLERAKAESLDRLMYTYFTVSITERTYIDGESLRDSWRYAIENAVRDINKLFQDATVGLILFVIMLLKFALYALIILIAVRFGWGFIKTTWENMGGKES